ncbi:hypothetical protein [Stetteria hydrogenophila]
MAASDVARAVNELASRLPSPSFDAGYVLALAGLVLLAVFGVAFLGIVTVRGVRAIANMPPEKFIVFTISLALALIVVGALLP